MTVTCYTSGQGLWDYATGEYLREATEDEIARSNQAALEDGGLGLIDVSLDADLK